MATYLPEDVAAEAREIAQALDELQAALMAGDVYEDTRPTEAAEVSRIAYRFSRLIDMCENDAEEADDNACKIDDLQAEFDQLTEESDKQKTLWDAIQLENWDTPELMRAIASGQSEMIVNALRMEVAK